MTRRFVIFGDGVVGGVGGWGGGRRRDGFWKTPPSGSRVEASLQALPERGEYKEGRNGGEKTRRGEKLLPPPRLGFPRHACRALFRAVAVFCSYIFLLSLVVGINDLYP